MVAMQTSMLLRFLLVALAVLRSSAGRSGVESREETGAAARLHQYLMSLPASQPHHICVTGNRAHSLMESLVLSPGHQLADLQLQSSLAPENECVVQDYSIGSTLFLVTDKIEDRCAARWKAHSSTCDVLMHAHDGQDCDQLWRLRLISNQCEAPLVVLHSEEELLKCYSEKANHAMESSLIPVSMDKGCFEVSYSVGKDETEDDAMLDSLIQALEKTPSSTSKTYSSLPDAEMQGLSDTERLRKILLQGKSSHAVHDVHLEMMKATQGLPADTDSIKILESVAKQKRSRLQTDQGNPEGSSFAQDSDEGIRGAGDGADAIPQCLPAGCTTPAIILDTGSGLLKAGFAGDPMPRVVLPSIVGIPRRGTPVMMPDIENELEDFVIGDDDSVLRGLAELHYPVQHGVVINWKLMDKLLHHTLKNELRIQDQQLPKYKVFMAEPPLNPNRNREEMAKLMFERYKVDALHIGMHAVLALYATGRSTGLVLEIGDGVTHVVPIVEGYALPHGIMKTSVAGKDLTRFMRRLLTEIPENEGRLLTSSAEFEVVRDIKEKMGYVSQNYEQDISKDDESFDKKYEMPDGSVVKVGSASFRVAEPLFQPGLVGVEGDGIARLLARSLQACDEGMRKKLAPKVMLSGGSSMFQGLKERLERELAKLLPDAGVKVEAEAHRDHFVWQGASLMSTMDAFQEFWYSKGDYGSTGAKGILKKFEIKLSS